MPSHVLPCQRFFRDDRSARKKRLPKISCNPLISIDSDERESKEIQAFPTLNNRGFRSETGAIQENPNRLDPVERRPAAEQGPNPLHLNAK
jgi:hypothetical protein